MQRTTGATEYVCAFRCGHARTMFAFRQPLLLEAIHCPVCDREQEIVSIRLGDLETRRRISA